MKKLVIAIDGPSSSGKGTIAKKVAEHFNLSYLNTGAIYRLVAFRIIEQKIDPNNFDEKISVLTKNISEADLENQKLFDEDVGLVASIIAKNKKFRTQIFDFQHQFIIRGKEEKNGCVLDGRDTTTVICPNADYKFFITADVEIRAKRRSNQLNSSSYEKVLTQLKERDKNDLNRTDSPLKIASDAVVIDNGALSIEQTLQKVLSYIDKKQN